MPDIEQADSPPPSSSSSKLYVRGIISNTIAIGILCLIGYFLELTIYVIIAFSVQLLVFAIHGLPNRSEKFYDLSGSATHLTLVVFSLVYQSSTFSVRQIVMSAVSTVWLLRLGSFLFLRVLRDGKDGRFDEIKQVWLAFLGAWSIQAVWVSLIQLPVMLVNTQDDTAPLNIVDIVAASIWGVGFMFEAISDHQKHVFRNIPKNKGKYITSGLWRYSRHPNYFGELLMWSGLALAASYTGYILGKPTLYWSWLSPVFTGFLLLGLTGVPLLEAAGFTKWGDDSLYLHYMAHTSKIIPWIPAPELDSALIKPSSPGTYGTLPEDSKN